jgi:hypothetical protein
MQVGKWNDSPMSGDRGEGDLLVGDVHPMDTLQLTGITPASRKSSFS